MICLTHEPAFPVDMMPTSADEPEIPLSVIRRTAITESRATEIDTCTVKSQFHGFLIWINPTRIALLSAPNQ